MGHTDRYCKNRDPGNNSERTRSATQSMSDSRGRNERASNQSIRRKKVIKDALAKLLTIVGDESDEDEDFIDHGSLSDEADCQDVVFNSGCAICDCQPDGTECKDGAQAMFTRDRRFIVDSGCRGAHVVKHREMLDKVIDTTQWNRKPAVQGITGHRLDTTDVGYLPGLGGMALVTPNADESLLSLMEIVKHADGTFIGNKSELIIRDSTGHIIIKALNRGDDFWTCSESDIQKGSLGNCSFVTNAVSQQHLTAEERKRADEAYNLCELLRHPGDAAIIAGLDGGCFGPTHLTAQDFRNARRLRGPCPACQEAKMRAPPEPSSHSEPAHEIGEHLHVDLIPLRHTSLGGNNFIFVAVDEKSTYLVGVPMKSKSAAQVLSAAKSTLVEFNRYGHKVRKITTDDEKTLLTLKEPLGRYGVIMSSTPAGLHEKRIERYIQTIKDRRRSMLAGLPYELPGILECESYMDAINWINKVPNSQLGSTTSHQLVTGQKPFIPRYHFGQVGLFYSPDKEEDKRSEWGIFIAYGPSPNYYRAYLPLKKHMYSKRKFLPQSHIPDELGLPRRLKLSKSLDARFPCPAGSSTQNVDIQTGEPLTLDSTHAVGEDIISPPTQGSFTSSNQEGATPLPHDGGTCQEGDRNELVDMLPTLPVTDINQRKEITDIIPTISQTEVNNTGGITDAAVPTSQRIEMEVSSAPKTNGTVPESSSSTRSKRSNVGNWKDGPAKEKGENFMVARDCKNRVKLATAVNIRDFKKDFLAMKISLREAIKNPERKEDILKSINAEIDNLEAPGVLKAVRVRDIPSHERKNIIGVYMFHKEKYKADGSFDKDKTRIVLLSNRRDPETIGETYCPTVNTISVFTQINLAATEKAEISAYDIKGAFLLTPMRTGKRMFIKVTGDVVKYWVQRYPSRVKDLDTDGCLYFEILRYIYGLHEAPHEFNCLLDNELRKVGFVPSSVDPCSYCKKVDGGFIRLSVHVDDILMTCPRGLNYRKWFEDVLEKQFVLVKQYDTISYLGMIVKKLSNDNISVDQKGYVTSILQKFGVSNIAKAPSTPATDRLMEMSSPKEILKDAKKYLSLIMSLMYVARLTRPDILMPVTYLSTKCKEPTSEDWSRALRILYYLGGTKDECLLFKSEVPFVPSICADASHHLYSEGHGQLGFFIFNGSAPVGFRSGKIRVITRSSTESELCALEEASTYAVWYKKLLNDMGITCFESINIYQDNKSAIIMAIQGGSFKRTKHMIAKHSYVKERILSKDIKIKYRSSAEMEADILTKPVTKAILNRLKSKLSMQVI